MSEWYLNIDEQHSGPFSSDELLFLAKQGRLPSGARVRQGMSGPWRSANSILKSSTPRDPEPKKPSPPAAAAVTDGSPDQQLPSGPVAVPPPPPLHSTSRRISPLVATVACGIGLLAALVVGASVWSGSRSNDTIATTPSPDGEQPPGDKTAKPATAKPATAKPATAKPATEKPKDKRGNKLDRPIPGTPKGPIQSLKGREAQTLVSQAMGNVVLGWRFIDEDGQKKESPFSMKRLVGDKSTAERLARNGARIRSSKTRDGKTAYWEYLLGSSGSCFFVTDNGFALTNKHVVEDFQQVKQARTKIREMKKGWGFESLEPVLWIIVDGKPHEGTVKFISEKFDLAAIKIDTQNCPFFRLSTLDEPALLTEVMAMGFPGAATDKLTDEDGDDYQKRLLKSRSIETSPVCEQKITLTRGEVSSISNRPSIGRLIQHGASINPGNSGGPLWESNSRAIIGINTFKIHEADGIFFALQMQQMRTEIDKHVPGVDWFSPLNPE
ncbi:MAG: trypsin-like peptidase domain-containing protein [Planctomycetota bacterium]|nr:trypsin-like peptidase domain-containing protein [Planctomycetota bacterium]